MERVMKRVKKEDGGEKRKGRRVVWRGIYRPLWPAEINWEGVTQARKNPNRAVTPRRPNWEGTCQIEFVLRDTRLYSWLEVSSATTWYVRQRGLELYYILGYTWVFLES